MLTNSMGVILYISCRLIFFLTEKTMFLQKFKLNYIYKETHDDKQLVFKCPKWNYEKFQPKIRKIFRNDKLDKVIKILYKNKLIFGGSLSVDELLTTNESKVYKVVLTNHFKFNIGSYKTSLIQINFSELGLFMSITYNPIINSYRYSIECNELISILIDKTDELINIYINLLYEKLINYKKDINKDREYIINFNEEKNIDLLYDFIAKNIYSNPVIDKPTININKPIKRYEFYISYNIDDYIPNLYCMNHENYIYEGKKHIDIREMFNNSFESFIHADFIRCKEKNILIGFLRRSVNPFYYDIYNMLIKSYINVHDNLNLKNINDVHIISTDAKSNIEKLQSIKKPGYYSITPNFNVTMALNEDIKIFTIGILIPYLTYEKNSNHSLNMLVDIQSAN